MRAHLKLASRRIALCYSTFMIYDLNKPLKWTLWCDYIYFHYLLFNGFMLPLFSLHIHYAYCLLASEMTQLVSTLEVSGHKKRKKIIKKSIFFFHNLFRRLSTSLVVKMEIKWHCVCSVKSLNTDFHSKVLPFEVLEAGLSPTATHSKMLLSHQHQI